MADPPERPLASVVVPNWNGAHLLPACLDSLAQQSYAPLEVIVADGASSDDSAALVEAGYPAVRLLRLHRNRGFTGNVNAGLRAARGQVLLLLNNDAVADREWVAAAVDALQQQPAVGAVASKMLYADGRTINAAGDQLGRDGYPAQRGEGQADGPAWDVPTEVFGASGGAVAYRRAMLADVGLFDESFFMYLEDVDLSFRAQLRGWRCWYEPSAEVTHLGSATGGGPLASYYNGRNLLWLLAKNLPAGLLRRVWSDILAAQQRRAREALRAWRGAAARATLRGQVAGLLGLAGRLPARRAIQSSRRVSDEYLDSILSPAVPE